MSRRKPIEDRERVNFSLSLREDGIVSRILHFFFENDLDPKIEVQQILVAFYGPLVVEEGQRDKFFSEVMAKVSAARLMTQVDMIRELYPDAVKGYRADPVKKELELPAMSDDRDFGDF